MTNPLYYLSRTHGYQENPKERLWILFKNWITGKPVYKSRIVHFDRDANSSTTKYPANVVRNQKYTLWNFLFVVLYEQFRYFFNLYFLVVALSQFIPPLQVGKQILHAHTYIYA